MSGTSSSSPCAEVGLGDILDRESLQRLCQALANLHRTGVSVVDCHAGLVVDGVPPGAPCTHLGPRKGARVSCIGYEKILAKPHDLRPGEQLHVSCPCGLENILLAVQNQGRTVGYVLVGPFTTRGPDKVTADLVELQQGEGLSADDPWLMGAVEELHGMRRIREERMREIVAAIGEVVAVMVHSGRSRHLTTQLHLAAVQDAYNEVSDRNQRLANTLEKLRELDRLKSGFMASVSHELRTPLTSIMGYSEMLLDGLAGDISTSQREFVDVIMGKAAALMELFSELLDMSRIAAGSLVLNLTQVNPCLLLTEVMGEMDRQFQRKGVHLVHEMPGDLPALRGDHDKLKQVLINLLNNALKFTPADGEVQVIAREADGGSALQFRVIDSGIGVEESERVRIFESFYQGETTPTREHGGTGLGLSIVKSFIEAHGGRVWVEPAEKRGAMFTVQLPLVRAGA